jgi:hypothetical protein
MPNNPWRGSDDTASALRAGQPSKSKPDKSDKDGNTSTNSLRDRFIPGGTFNGLRNQRGTSKPDNDDSSTSGKPNQGDDLDGVPEIVVQADVPGKGPTDLTIPVTGMALAVDRSPVREAGYAWLPPNVDYSAKFDNWKQIKRAFKPDKPSSVGDSNRTNNSESVSVDVSSGSNSAQQARAELLALMSDDKNTQTGLDQNTILLAGAVILGIVLLGGGQ